MSEVTRRELMKRAAAAGLGGALVSAPGIPDMTPAEAATLGDGRMGARIRAYRKWTSPTRGRSWTGGELDQAPRAPSKEV